MVNKSDDNSDLPERCREPLRACRNAVKDTRPVRASEALDKLNRALYELHPDWAVQDRPTHHRSDVEFDAPDRGPEFVQAIRDALERHDDGVFWLIVAQSEILGFRRTVLDQTDKELGFVESDETTE